MDPRRTTILPAEPLLMIPGPTPVSPDVLSSMAQPLYAHTSAACAEDLLEVQRQLCEITGNSDGRALAFAGSGTLAMESAAISLVAPGQEVLCVSNGYFGERFAEILRRQGAVVHVLATEAWGQAVDPGRIAEAVRPGRFAAVTLTHVDTSTAVEQPLAASVRAVRENSEALVLVDGVCATGGIAEPMTDLGIDAVVTCCQKALAVPPGMALLSLGPRALARLETDRGIGSLYLDLRQWLPIMADPRTYFSTHAVTMVRALRAGLGAVLGEGLEARFSRHRDNAERLRRGFVELGFAPLTQPRFLAPTVSILAYPEGVDDLGFRQRMLEEGVMVAGCVGEWAGRAVRVGHMGNVGAAEVDQTLAAARSAM